MSLVEAASLPTTNVVNVTPVNVKNYFTTHGSGIYNGSDWKSSIEQGTGLITLTQDSSWLVGNVTLNTKINLNQDFSFKGQINLGNKDKSQGGADGIGFVFQPGDTDIVGKPGQWLGMGGVPNAFGFKLDTFYNDTATYGNFDPSVILDNTGNNVIQNGDTNAAFGDFMSTDSNGTMITSPTVGGTPALVVPNPTDNDFDSFEINYIAETRILKVIYNGLVWSEDISSLIPSDGRVSFAITGSTGGSMNQQQLKIENFSFSEAKGNITVNYVDQNGEPIAPSQTMVGELYAPYTTSPLADVPGKYQLVATPSNASGTYTANDQTVTYVYNIFFQASIPHVITETVNYIDQNGRTLTSPNVQQVTVVMVTNPVTGNKTTYYKLGVHSQPQVDATGKLDSSWTQNSSVKFSSVNNPVITNYHVVSTTDPANDLEQTVAKTVNENSSDLNFTVTYTHDTGTITIHAIDRNGRELHSPTLMTGNTGDSYTTIAPNIPGYKLIKTPENRNGDYTSSNQDVEYIYVIDYQVVDFHIVNEKINYVDQNGNPLAPIYSANVTFVSIINPVTKEKNIYYKIGKNSNPMINDDGLPDFSWTKSDIAIFSVVKNPLIKGFHVVLTTDSDSNLEATAEKKVMWNTDNIVIKVVYDTESIGTPPKTLPQKPLKVNNSPNLLQPSQSIISSIKTNLRTYPKKIQNSKKIFPNLGEKKDVFTILVGILLLLGLLGLKKSKD